MYNRYIPDDTAYTRAGAEQPFRPDRSRQGPGERPRGSAFRLPDFLSGREGLGALFSGGEKGGLSALWKAFHLDDIDSGDVLLLLIVLYLLVEGDDLDLVIALGLVLIMGLGDGKEDGD